MGQKNIKNQPIKKGIIQRGYSKLNQFTILIFSSRSGFILLFHRWFSEW